MPPVDKKPHEGYELGSELGARIGSGTLRRADKILNELSRSERIEFLHGLLDAFEEEVMGLISNVADEEEEPIADILDGINSNGGSS